MLKLTAIISLLILINASLFAQIDSVSLRKETPKNLPRLFILPSTIIISGVIIKETKYRESIQKDVQTSSLKTNNHIDDFIQYAPMAEIYIADICYSKTKNEVFQQSKNLIISQLFTAIIVQSLKITTNVTRPNGASHSFPSGHTSVAFTGATALYLEYRDINPLLAYSGYGFSTTTGLLRVTNNKHWASDVLVGAGIGMLSARLIWYINPFKNWDPFKKKKIAIYPSVNHSENSLGFCLVF
jgi:hypothetical protein